MNAYILVAVVIMSDISYSHVITNMCPPADILHCAENSDECREDQMKMQSFFNRDDGTTCEACEICVFKDDPCWPRACPMISRPTCPNFTFASQFIFHDNRECYVCDTYWCTDFSPFIFQ